MNLTHPSMGAGGRSVALDGLRGWLLIIIAINHLQGELFTRFTRESFGFVSAAEGFLLLSGWIAAQVYGRYTEQPAELRRRIWHRAWRLYLYTLAGSALIIVLLQLGLLPTSVIAADNDYFLMGNYVDAPLTTFALTLVQLQQMSFFDILVMYFLPMLVLPWALQALVAGRGYWVLLISGGLWLLAPWISLAPLGEWLNRLADSDWRWQFTYGDLLAWQLLFYIGVFAGYGARFKAYRWGLDKPWLRWGVLIVAVGLWCVRHQWWSPAWLDFNKPFWGWAFDWAHVGPVRLLNTLMLAFLLAWALRAISVQWFLAQAQILGQHSLQVFVFHSVAIYFFWAAMHWAKNKYISGLWWSIGDLLISLLFIVSLYLAAWAHRQWLKSPVVDHSAVPRRRPRSDS